MTKNSPAKLIDIKTLNLFLEKIVNAEDQTIVDQQLIEMLAIINHILIVIKLCDNFIEATFYFDLLQKIHDTLDTLIFHKQFDVTSPELQKFASDCERLDDNRDRQYLYQKIKAGTYSLSDTN